MDITNKIDLYREDELVDLSNLNEADASIFSDVANFLNDVQDRGGKGDKMRLRALKKLETKIKRSTLPRKLKDAFLNGLLKGFKKGAGVR